jgi:hypothetical protein
LVTLRASYLSAKAKVSNMQLEKTTKTHKFYKRGDGRFAVKTRAGVAVNGEEKIALLLAEGLIAKPKAKPAPKQPDPEPEVAEAAEAEAVAAEETPAEEAPAEEAPVAEAGQEEEKKAD